MSGCEAMRKVFVLLLVFGVVSVAYCAGTNIDITFDVKNEEGQPIEDAKIVASFLGGSGTDQKEGLTNRNGSTKLSGSGHFGVDFRITKEGFYESVGGRAPRGQVVDIVLREVRDPIAMYAKYLDFYNTEYVNEVLRYDFLVGDYLPPHGSGSNADIEILWKHESSGVFHFRSDLTIEFLGENNGMVKFVVPIEKRYSSFKSDYKSVASGFIKKWNFSISRNGVDEPELSNLDSDANYYLRIRTEVDDNGKVVYSHYGKIYGEVDSDSKGVPYYINPSPNDRNIEFDWKQNLFGGLPEGLRVFAP